MEQLKTFEIAASYLGLDPTVLPGIVGLPEKHAKAIVAIYKLSILSEAAWKLEGKVLNWDDYEQLKYYTWFDMSGSASGFSYGVYAYDITYSNVGSRLVFPSDKSRRYVGETHLELYRDLMVI